MTTDPNSPAYPVRFMPPEGGPNGLTFRQLFAAMAMQGMLADPNASQITPELMAGAAVEFADALIAALNKEGK